jgi:hypothetical protein
MTSPPNSTKAPYPLEIDGVELFDDEDLACAIPGARLVRGPLFKDDFFSYLKKQAEEEFAKLPKPRPSRPKPSRPRKPSKPTLAEMAKQASKAGIEVARYEVKPDGTVVVVVGGTPTTNESDNPWDIAAAALRQKRVPQ